MESRIAAVAFTPRASKQPRKDVALAPANAACSSRCTSATSATVVLMRTVMRTSGADRLLLLPGATRHPLQSEHAVGLSHNTSGGTVRH